MTCILCVCVSVGIEGFWLKSGLYDTTPLHNYLNTNLNATAVHLSDRQLLMGATSLTEARYETFSQTDPDLVLGVLSSSAIPGLFPPIAKSGQLFVDGGTCSVLLSFGLWEE